MLILTKQHTCSILKNGSKVESKNSLSILDFELGEAQSWTGSVVISTSAIPDPKIATATAPPSRVSHGWLAKNVPHRVKKFSRKNAVHVPSFSKYLGCCLYMESSVVPSFPTWKSSPIKVKIKCIQSNKIGRCVLTTY